MFASGGGAAAATSTEVSPDVFDRAEPARKRAKVASLLSPTGMSHQSTPEGRWAHTATPIGDHSVVIYGGQSNDDQTLGNLFVWRIDTQTWQEPVNCNSVPRAWHTASYLKDKNLVVTFGGERAGDGEDSAPEVLDDIMVLDTEIFLWYPPSVSGKPPSARAGHSACLLHGSELVIFGGSR